MLKKALFIITAIFLAIGGILFFSTPDSSKITQNSTSKEPTTLNGYIIKNDFNMQQSLSKLAQKCGEDIHENIKACIASELYAYIKNSFILDNSSNNKKPNPRLAYKNRQGSYLDLTLLYSSFLVNSGISSYIRFDEERIFAFACGITNVEMLAEIKQSLKKNPLSQKDITLKKKQVWAVDFSRGDDKKHLAADINAIASKKFDMVLFPNKIEMNAFVKAEPARKIRECEKLNVDEVALTCTVPNGSFLLFRSLEDNNKLKVNISRGGLLLEDIKSEKSKQGSSCIKVDIKNDSPFQFPGIAIY